MHYVAQQKELFLLIINCFLLSDFGFYGNSITWGKTYTGSAHPNFPFCLLYFIPFSLYFSTSLFSSVYGIDYRYATLRGFIKKKKNLLYLVLSSFFFFS